MKTFLKTLVVVTALALFIWLAYASQHREMAYTTEQINAKNKLIERSLAKVTVKPVNKTLAKQFLNLWEQ